jgi:hypothetical protein
VRLCNFVLNVAPTDEELGSIVLADKIHKKVHISMMFHAARRGTDLVMSAMMNKIHAFKPTRACLQ